jgi:hypothetical protein
MATYPSAKGRESRRTGREGSYSKPPKGSSWVWHTEDMLISPAWRALSINAKRVIERVELEHMAHGGNENGTLPVTHQNFRKHGIYATAIAPAIQEAIFLGFIRCVQGGRWNEKNTPSIFRITWLGDKNGNAPTNEWQSVTQEQIDVWKSKRNQSQKARKQWRKNLKHTTETSGTVTRLSVVRGGKHEGGKK